MKFLRLYFLIIFFGINLSHNACGQAPNPNSHKLIVNLENAQFDSLYLYDYTEGRHVVIAGERTKNFTWKITIPDSIVWDFEDMELLASPYDLKSNSLQLIRFITNREKNKTIIVNVGVEDEYSYIFGTYVDTAHFAREHVIKRIGNKDSVTVGNIISQNFGLIIKDSNSDMAIRALDPFFSWFMSPNGEKISYDDQLKFYTNLSKKHPGSRYLIANLATNLTMYKSKDDVKKVYENFSDKHKNTIWAKNIERFLYGQKFENTSLPSVKTNSYENIVQDKSKYNLIIFTASWCAPCMEEIPLLKRIYKELGKNLNLTYVSIDNSEGAVSLKKILREKNIPWHTLFAYQDVKKIKQKYFVEAIPHVILVYPNQDMKILDIRKDEDRTKLYSICKALQN
jgi:thiol-disulfide isomerase/thioredoxin